MSRSRIGLVNRSSLQGEYMTKTKKIAYKLCDLFPQHCPLAMNSSEDFCNLLALEQVHGINFKVVYIRIRFTSILNFVRNLLWCF